MKSNYPKGSLFLVTACLIWGLSFTIIKISVSQMPAIGQIALRFSIAFVTMLVCCWRKIKSITKRDIMCGFWMGIASFIAFIFQTYAFVYGMASKVAFLTASFVVFTPLLEWIYEKKRPNGKYFIGAVICLIGIACMSLNQQYILDKGDLLAVCGAVFFAIHIIQTSKFTRTQDPIKITSISFFFIAGFALVSSLLIEGVEYDLRLTDICNGLFLGVLATSVAYSLQSIGQRYLPPTVSAIILSLESVFGCFFAVILLHEKMTVRLVIGSLLIFVSIVSVQINTKRGERKDEKVDERNES